MTTIDESARAADLDDLEVIEALHTHAIEEIQDQRGGPMWVAKEARPAPAGASLAQDLDDDDHLLVVGTIDGAVVGYSAVRLVRLHDAGTVAVVDDIYVLSDARGVGVGEAMLDFCIGWAREHGCTGVDSHALPGDRHTKNFFESFGLVARAIVVHRSLEEPG